MRKFVLFLIFFSSALSVYAGSTDASKYAEEHYSRQIGNPRVHINVKKEHTVEYQQKIGEQLVPAITYGYGDMKTIKGKKTRVSYIVLLDAECKPICSFIVPSK